MEPECTPGHDGWIEAFSVGVNFPWQSAATAQWAQMKHCSVLPRFLQSFNTTVGQRERCLGGWRLIDILKQDLALQRATFICEGASICVFTNLCECVCVCVCAVWASCCHSNTICVWVSTCGLGQLEGGSGWGWQFDRKEDNLGMVMLWVVCTDTHTHTHTHKDTLHWSVRLLPTP